MKELANLLGGEQARRQTALKWAGHTYQSDVETVHRLEEDEFFDLETFSGRSDFLAKVHTYQLYFNLARPNSHKQNQTPWQIILRLALARRSNSACFHRCSWTTTSTSRGDTISLSFPNARRDILSEHAALLLVRVECSV